MTSVFNTGISAAVVLPHPGITSYRAAAWRQPSVSSLTGKSTVTTSRRFCSEQQHCFQMPLQRDRVPPRGSNTWGTPGNIGSAVAKGPWPIPFSKQPGWPDSEAPRSLSYEEKPALAARHIGRDLMQTSFITVPWPGFLAQNLEGGGRVVKGLSGLRQDTERLYPAPSSSATGMEAGGRTGTGEIGLSQMKGPKWVITFPRRCTF